MQKIIAEALQEEVSKNGLMNMTRRSTVIDYDRLALAVIEKLEQYHIL